MVGKFTFLLQQYAIKKIPRRRSWESRESSRSIIRIYLNRCWWGSLLFPRRISFQIWCKWPRRDLFERQTNKADQSRKSSPCWLIITPCQNMGFICFHLKGSLWDSMSSVDTARIYTGSRQKALIRSYLPSSGPAEICVSLSVHINTGHKTLGASHPL